MKKTLSASALKHEAFVLALLSGMTAADAARKAGYGRKNINVRIIAWELLQRVDIQKRLTELSEAAVDEAIMTLVQRKIRLSEIAGARYNDPDRDGDPIVAIDLLNRLDGAYKTKPREVHVAPIASVTAGRVREKLAAKIKRIGSGAIVSGDIDSLVEDGCSEEQDTKNLEVTHE